MRALQMTDCRLIHSGQVIATRVSPTVPIMPKSSVEGQTCTVTVPDQCRGFHVSGLAIRLCWTEERECYALEAILYHGNRCSRPRQNIMKIRQMFSFIVDTLRSRLLRIVNPSAGKVDGIERDAAWYDLSYTLFKHWKRHYTQSHYYFLWSVVADRLLTCGHECILDIGCGPGQFACLVQDRGMQQYYGLDFSEQRIKQARTVCPGYSFHVEDAFETDKFTSVPYDAVVMTEVLEHVENDLELIERITPGRRLIASVPNFPSAGHVRFFDSIDEVYERYSRVLSRIRIDSLKADKHGKIYHLIDGIVGK